MTAPERGLRERVAEVLSWAGGEMTRWSKTAHPDHNRWSWRGDGHGEAMREEFRERADAVLGEVAAWLESEAAWEVAVVALEDEGSWDASGVLSATGATCEALSAAVRAEGPSEVRR